MREFYVEACGQSYAAARLALNTPRHLIAALNAAVVRALGSADVLQRLQSLGLTASPSTPEEFTRQMREDFALWGKVVKASGAKVD